MDEKDRQLQENFEQAALRLEAATPPAPERSHSVRRALVRTTAIKQQAARRLAWTPWGPAHFATIMLFTMVLTIILVPFVRQAQLNQGEEPRLWMTTPAWASTEGYVIEFTVPYASWDDLPDTSEPEHPRNEIRDAVDTWLGQHSGLQSEAPGLPLADVSMSYYCKEEPEAKLEFQILVSLSDRELAADLAGFIAARTGYMQPRIGSQTLYYSSEYPKLLSEQRTVRIDGREYAFPYDFTIEEARSVARAMRNWKTRYEGRGGFGIGMRFGDCAVYKVEHMPDGVLDYSVVARELDVDPDIRRGIQGSSNTIFELDPEDLAHRWRDPVLELIRLGRNAKWSLDVFYGKAEPEISVEQYQLGTWLVPEDKWQQLEERREGLIDKGREVLPELTAEDWEEIEAYAEGLKAGLPSDVPEKCGKSWLELAQDDFNRDRARAIDRETRMTPEYRSFPELSAQEREQALALAAELREVTREWYARHAEEVYETSPIAEFNRTVHTVGDAPVWFRVRIKCNDAALVEDLRQQLEAVDGLCRPMEVKQFTSTTRIGEP